MNDYSQDREQEHILTHTPVGGTVLDIGAYDPERFSNSRALIEAGSKAVLVECAPTQVRKLATFYNGNPRVQVVQAAVGINSSPAMIGMMMHDECVSTADARVYETWKGKVDGADYYGKVWVPVVRPEALVKMLFNWAGGPMLPHFVNIDVEGFSAKFCMEFIPLLPVVPRCICVEHDSMTGQLERWGMKHGYRIVFGNGTNLVMAQ